jgi:hypothetical protein
MQLANLVQVRRMRNVGVTGLLQHFFERTGARRLIIDDQDFGFKNLGCANHASTNERESLESISLQ